MTQDERNAYREALHQHYKKSMAWDLPIMSLNLSLTRLGTKSKKVNPLGKLLMRQMHLQKPMMKINVVEVKGERLCLKLKIMS